MTLRNWLFPPLAIGLMAAGTPQGGRYDRCIALARKQPTVALEQATAWRAEGGGPAAMHCQAIALIEQGNPLKAAGVLDAAANAIGPQPKSTGFAAALWAQAGNAWLLAGDAARAENRLTTALTLLPPAGDARVNVLIDRARTRAERTDWPAVIADLDEAAKLAPSSATVFLLRATARRRTGDLAAARSDILMAGTLAPDNVDILVERGISHAQSQQLEAALADWRRVIALAPQSDQAKIARGYLDQLAPLKK